MVVPALIEAGLPEMSVEPFLQALTTGMTASFAKIPGANPQVIQAGAAAMRSAYANAFRVTWLATIAFGVLAFIAACASRDIDKKLSHDVIRRLDVVGKKVTPNKRSDNSKPNVGQMKSTT